MPRIVLLIFALAWAVPVLAGCSASVTKTGPCVSTSSACPAP